MNRWLLGIALIGLVFSLSNEVAAAPCRFNEILYLSPLELLVGDQVTTRAPNGRFTTDAGVEFLVGEVRVTASLDVSGAYGNTVQIDLVDPFRGESHQITLELAP